MTRCVGWGTFALATACRQEHSDPAPPPSSASEISSAPERPFNPALAKLHSVGQLARASDYTARVERIVECHGKTGFRPEPGHVFLGVELEVKNQAGMSLAFGHSHAKLEDADGHHYAARLVVNTENCEPLFKYSRLARASSMKGWLVYSIPEQAASLMLTLDPRPYLGESKIRFQLGR